jgi:hypothetical protein
MARKTGQIIRRGPNTWLVRIYVGRDSETRRRIYIGKTIQGGPSESLDTGRHIRTNDRQAIVVTLVLSLLFADFPSEKCFEKCCEFGRLGRQLSSPVTDFVEIQGQFRFKLAHSHLAIT